MQLILAYSWARPAILAASKGWVGVGCVCVGGGGGGICPACDIQAAQTYHILILALQLLPLYEDNMTICSPEASNVTRELALE